MPKPHPTDETHDEWMHRCMPQVLQDGTAESNDQAVAMCMQMWRDATKASTKMITRNLDLSFDLKQIGAREFEGHGAVFGNVDLGGDIVIPGAFKRSLAEHAKAGELPPMFWMHQPDQVPGVWTEMKEDKKGLYVKGELLDTVLGNDMRTLAQKRAVRGLSIGYQTVIADFDKEGNRLLKEVNLFEVSLVSLAMNPFARIDAVKARLSRDGEYIPTEREFERHLRAVGCSKNVARMIIARIYDDQTGGMPDSARWDAGEVGEEAEARAAADAVLAKFATACLKY